MQLNFLLYLSEYYGCEGSDMNAEIISVGTELLMGQIVNSDAAFIAKQLTGLGIDSYFQTVVGDNPGK